MLATEILEHFARGPRATGSGVLQPLPDALGGVGLGGQVEQAFVGFRVSHNRRPSPFTVSLQTDIVPSTPV